MERENSIALKTLHSALVKIDKVRFDMQDTCDTEELIGFNEAENIIEECFEKAFDKEVFDIVKEIIPVLRKVVNDIMSTIDEDVFFDEDDLDFNHIATEMADLIARQIIINNYQNYQKKGE